MITKISKWGNSLGVRIPKEILEGLRLKKGSKINIKQVDGGILIAAEKRQPTLDEMLAGITPENMHPLYLEGPLKGKEII